MFGTFFGCTSIQLVSNMKRQNIPFCRICQSLTQYFLLSIFYVGWKCSHTCIRERKRNICYTFISMNILIWHISTLIMLKGEQNDRNIVPFISFVCVQTLCVIDFVYGNVLFYCKCLYKCFRVSLFHLCVTLFPLDSDFVLYEFIEFCPHERDGETQKRKKRDWGVQRINIEKNHPIHIQVYTFIPHLIHNRWISKLSCTRIPTHCYIMAKKAHENQQIAWKT